MYIYGIGTSEPWDGTCIFWQVNSAFRVKIGNIMLYEV